MKKLMQQQGLGLEVEGRCAPFPVDRKTDSTTYVRSSYDLGTWLNLTLWPAMGFLKSAIRTYLLVRADSMWSTTAFLSMRP